MSFALLLCKTLSAPPLLMTYLRRNFYPYQSLLLISKYQTPRGYSISTLLLLCCIYHFIGKTCWTLCWNFIQHWVRIIITSFFLYFSRKIWKKNCLKSRISWKSSSSIKVDRKSILNESFYLNTKVMSH